MRSWLLIKVSTFLMFVGLGSVPISAQNLAGIMGPNVRENDRSMQLRVAAITEREGARTGWATRIHYQHTVDGAVLLRAVLEGRDDGHSGFRTTAAQGEVMWQITPNSQRVGVGIRADARIGWNGGSDLVALNLGSEAALDPRWSVRTHVRSVKLLSPGDPQSLQWLSRARVNYKLSPAELSFEYFANHGSLSRDGKPDTIQIGPSFSIPLGRVNIYSGYLHGIGGTAPKGELRLWLGYRF